MATHLVTWKPYWGQRKTLEVHSTLDLLRMKAQPQYVDHVAGVVKDLKRICKDVRVRRDIVSSNGCCLTIAHKRKPKIWIAVAHPKLTDSSAYAEAMHEFGHAYTHYENRDQSTMELEYIAWRWALDNMIEEPSEQAYRNMARWFGGYWYCEPDVEVHHSALLRDFVERGGSSMSTLVDSLGGTWIEELHYV